VKKPKHNGAAPATAPHCCPNPACCYHSREAAAAVCREGERWYILFGRFWTESRGFIQRFRCKDCGRTCSTQTFSIDYWTRLTVSYRALLAELTSGSGLRRIAARWGTTLRVVRNRTRRLARNCLAVMICAALHCKERNLQENLVFDGFESFTRSQYHPNNFTIIAGSDSQAIYGVTYTALRRKGAMTGAQKRRNAHIKLLWRPPRSIEASVRGLFSDFVITALGGAHRRGTLELHSDEHRSYPRALGSIPALARAIDDGLLEHHRTSSRAARTRANALFALNYIDRLLRARCAEHARETIYWPKEVNSAMERFAIFAVAYNFLTAHRAVDRNDQSAEPTHGEIAGFEASPEVCTALEELYTVRHVASHYPEAPEWAQEVWQRRYENPPVVDPETGEKDERRATCEEVAQHLVA